MGLNQGYIYRVQVGSQHAGLELVEFHALCFRHSTRIEWLAHVAAGRVLRNGRLARAGEQLASGDRLEFHRAPWQEPEAPREFRVLHEDQDLLVLDKPAGLQVLPAGGFCASTLLGLVQARGGSWECAAPVHRLGTGTSGLIVFGKSALGRAQLSRQFREREAQKTYLAWVQGCGLPSSLQARHSIGPVDHGPLVIHAASPAGKAALTRLRVLRREPSLQRALVAAQPVTGRPDQIRIHLAACGAPILGDPLFGAGGLPISNARPGQAGYYLHAAALLVRHPRTQTWLKLRSLPAWLEGPDAPQQVPSGTSGHPQLDGLDSPA